MENCVENSELWLFFWRKIAQEGAGLELREELLRRYAEPHRAYHTAQHLNECLILLQQQSHLVERPEELFFALYYHDAIYDISSQENEAKSAHLAIRHLSKYSVHSRTIESITNLIRVTALNAKPVTLSEKLMVDIDIAILGATQDRFLEYERQIRKEYKLIPDGIFQRERKRILSGFLSRPQIYHTDYFIAHFEARARANLGNP